MLFLERSYVTGKSENHLCTWGELYEVSKKRKSFSRPPWKTAWKKLSFSTTFTQVESFLPGWLMSVPGPNWA